MRLGVVAVQQHGLKEVQLPDEDSRDAYKQDENDETQGERDLGHDDGACCQKDRPAVDHECGLLLVEALLDKPVLDVACVGLGNGRMAASTAHDGGKRVDDGHAGDDERHNEGRGRRDAVDAQQRDDAEQKAQHVRAAVAHENRCRVEVVAQKAQAAAGKDAGKHGGVNLVGLVGQIEHCGAGDGRDAGRKAVEPVDEVDDVGEGHEVDDRDGVGEPSDGNELGREGVGDIADYQAGGSGCACGENLSQQFLARLEVAHVVDGAREEDNDDGNGQQLVVDALQLHVRNKDGGPPKQLGSRHLHRYGSHKSQRDADAAHAGNRYLVDASFVGLVDGT